MYSVLRGWRQRPRRSVVRPVWSRVCHLVGLLWQWICTEQRATPRIGLDGTRVSSSSWQVACLGSRISKNLTPPVAATSCSHHCDSAKDRNLHKPMRPLGQAMLEPSRTSQKAIDSFPTNCDCVCDLGVGITCKEGNCPETARRKRTARRVTSCGDNTARWCWGRARQQETRFCPSAAWQGDKRPKTAIPGMPQKACMKGGSIGKAWRE